MNVDSADETAAKQRTQKLWVKCFNAKIAALDNGADDQSAQSVAAEIWNAWAAPLIEKRAEIRASEESQYGDLHSEALTIFASGMSQNADTNFQGFLFPGATQFINVRFPSVAVFSDAKFYDTLELRGVHFEKFAHFARAEFFGPATFVNIEFARDVSFNKATFNSDARFDSSSFHGHAYFDNINFKGNASFNGAQADKAIYFTESSFAVVPDFSATRFSYVPRVDVMRIKEIIWIRTRDSHVTAKYRKLKEFAIVQHDHARELDFFAGEIVAERTHGHKWWQPIFLIGVVYQLLANFGRWPLLPLFWWVVSTAGFSYIYHSNSIPKFDALKVFCPSQNTAWEALYLAVQTGLLSIGWNRSGRLKVAYECLYGKEPADVPLSVAFATTSQMLLSVLLIFLFFLCIRNYFRIK